jgi:hypothetical protein
MTFGDWLVVIWLLLIGAILAMSVRDAGAILRAAVQRLQWRRATKTARTTAGQAANASPAAPPIDDGWFALPGGTRLEYRASGFAIELRPANAAAPYCLLSPEGVLLAASPVLFQLKNIGVFAAGERAQFSPESGQNGAQT